jgi:hypothetical protein
VAEFEKRQDENLDVRSAEGKAVVAWFTAILNEQKELFTQAKGYYDSRKEETDFYAKRAGKEAKLRDSEFKLNKMWNDVNVEY